MSKLSTEVIKKAITEVFDCPEKSIKRISKKKNDKKEIERTFNAMNKIIIVISDSTDTNILKIEESSMNESKLHEESSLNPEVKPSDLQQKVIDDYIQSTIKSLANLNIEQVNLAKIISDKNGNIESIYHIPKSIRGEFYLTVDVSSEGEIIGYSQISPSEYKREYCKKTKGKKKTKFSDYFFAVATQKEEGEDYFLVSILHKQFWEDNGHSDDQPCPIMDELPSFIDDLNESSEMAAYVEDWQEVYTEFIQLGMEYNNELARFLNENHPQLHMHIVN